MTESRVTGSDVSHVTGIDNIRKYIMRMRNRKLRHIRPSGAFWPEVTKSRDRKRPCPEVSLTEVGSAHARLFPRVFFFECTQPEVVQHL
jgi:hypothetical protein